MYQTVKNRKIRIAVLGCGRISKNHFSSIEKHGDNIELVAVCDSNPTILKAHSSKYSVPGYLRLEDMLQTEKLDILAICTPSGLHPDQTVTAARHGVHIMTEKPMATRWQDGLRMVRACDEARVRLFVVKQNRCNSTLQLLKRAVEEKRFGRIYMVHINVFCPAPRSITIPPSGAAPGSWMVVRS